MIWNKNLVIVLATLGALNTYLCNAAEQKEHQESAAPIAYRADGTLAVQSGQPINDNLYWLSDSLQLSPNDAQNITDPTTKYLCSIQSTDSQVRTRNIPFSNNEIKCDVLAYARGYLVAEVFSEKGYSLQLYRTSLIGDDINSFDVNKQHSLTHNGQEYKKLELSKVKPGKRPTLIATKPERGADLYSITRPWSSNTDKLVKTTSIETDGEVQHIASTPARYFGLYPAKTALSTPQTIHEIDSRTGEEIARYDKATAKQTYWNWRRTARRTAYATAATLTSVAAAVLSYKWYKGQS